MFSGCQIGEKKKTDTPAASSRLHKQLRYDSTGALQFHWEYVYSADGTLTNLNSYNTSNVLTGTATCTCDSQGRLLQQTDGSYTATYTYNASGYLTRWDGGSSDYELYTLNSQGEITRSDYYHSSTFNNYKLFTYDADGKRVSSTSYSTTGTPTGFTASYLYDSNGRLSEVDLTDSVTPSNSSKAYFSYEDGSSSYDFTRTMGF